MTRRALEFFQQLQNPALFPEAGGGAGRILKVADEIKRLEPAEFAGFFQTLQNGFQVREVKAVAFEPDAARADAATLENAQKHKIRGVFDEDDVAFVTKRLQGHVQQLLRTAGDQHAFPGVNFGRDGVPPSLTFGTPTRRPSQIQFLQVAGGEPAQVGFAGRDAVLERGLAGFGRAQDPVEQFAGKVHRQGGVVGETGGERNQSGPRQRGLHEPGDGRRPRAAAECGQGGRFHFNSTLTFNIQLPTPNLQGESISRPLGVEC